jgi:adenylate kinase family enzyme
MKILIIGIVASGKTTLAKKLSKEYKIKHYEIDLIVHDDKDNYKRTNEEQQNLIKRINENDNWIIEGTLRKNLFNLLQLADIIIYLDIPLMVRKRRILTRFIKQKLRIEKSNYKPDLKMLKNMYKWTKDFEKNKKEFENTISKSGKKIIVLKSKKEIESFKIQ